jgi:hypothetical protein
MNTSPTARRWNRLSFRLPALIVMFAAVTGIVGGSIAYALARQGFIEVAKERVELVRNERARAITTLVDDIRIGLALPRHPAWSGARPQGPFHGTPQAGRYPAGGSHQGLHREQFLPQRLTFGGARSRRWLGIFSQT